MVIEKSDKRGSEFWYLDTGCSNHMTGNKHWVMNLDTSQGSKVRFVDSFLISCEGVIENVMYCLTMDSNLLSLG